MTKLSCPGPINVVEGEYDTTGVTDDGHRTDDAQICRTLLVLAMRRLHANFKTIIVCSRQIGGISRSLNPRESMAHETRMIIIK